MTDPFPSQKNAIVNMLIKALQDNEVTDAEHFFKNPFKEIDPDELPAVKVAIMSSPAEKFNSKVEYKHSPEIIIAYFAQNSEEELYDILYYYAERIYDFFIRAEASGALAPQLNLMNFTNFDLSLERAETGIGGAVLRFQGEYFSEHEPDLDDLEGFNVKVSAKGATPDSPPIYEDEIDVEQEEGEPEP